VDRRAHPAGTRRRSRGQRRGRHRHGNQRRRSPGDRRLRHRHNRGHRGLDGVLAQARSRGLTVVELVISDAHGGIKAAIGTVFSGASWQRRRTHFMANLASADPRPIQFSPHSRSATRPRSSTASCRRQSSSPSSRTRVVARPPSHDAPPPPDQRHIPATLRAHYLSKSGRTKSGESRPAVYQSIG
jgi:hypothetical protein